MDSADRHDPLVIRNSDRGARLGIEHRLACLDLEPAEDLLQQWVIEEILSLCSALVTLQHIDRLAHRCPNPTGRSSLGGKCPGGRMSGTTFWGGPTGASGSIGAGGGGSGSG